jgi:hypothetical protein
VRFPSFSLQKEGRGWNRKSKDVSSKYAELLMSSELLSRIPLHVSYPILGMEKSVYKENLRHRNPWCEATGSALLMGRIKIAIFRKSI